MLMKADGSCLIIVDVQARLVPAIAGSEEAVENSATLMKAAARLGVPMLVSEQYPKGLGSTVDELARLAPNDSVIEKVDFSCLADAGFARRFDAVRPQDSLERISQTLLPVDECAVAIEGQDLDFAGAHRTVAVNQDTLRLLVDGQPHLPGWYIRTDLSQAISGT